MAEATVVAPSTPRVLRPVPPDEAREIALALEDTARDLARDVELNEPLVTAAALPGLTDNFRRLRRRAELVGLAHIYFKELSERPETPVIFDRHHIPPVTNG